MCSLTVRVLVVAITFGAVFTAGAQHARSVVWTPVTEFDDPVVAIDFYIKRLVDEHMAIPIDELVSRFDDAVMVGHLKSELAGSDGDSPLYRRNGLLVLARFGDPAAIEEAIGLVQRIEDRETRVQGMGRLAYISQPEALAYLKPYLFSDVVYEPKSKCLVPVSEAYCAAEALGGMLEGFPRKGTIEERRAWMNSQTSYKFNSGLVQAGDGVVGDGTPGELTEPRRGVTRRPMRSQRALRGR